MKILSLNCQTNYHPRLKRFLKRTLVSERYDILLLQEANEKVVKCIKKNKKYILTLPTQGTKKALTCIVSHKKIALSSHIDFLHFPYPYLEQTAFKDYHLFWLTCTIASIDNQEIVLGSMHLPAGFSSVLRKKHLKQSLQYIRKKYGDTMAILWGDFNFWFPWEMSEAAKLVSPSFACVSQEIPYTLDSYYTETGHGLTSYVALLLRYVWLSIKLKTDHFFTHKNILKKYKTQVRVLPHRVSDHSPIELVLISK